MKSSIICILAFFCFFYAKGQSEDVQWASSVIESSSHYTDGLLFKPGLNYRTYPAERILGVPDFYPRSGDSPNAWVPKKSDNMDYIKVGFENPSQIQQIVIAETNNPSAVYRIFAYDENDNEHLINTFEPRPIPNQSRLFNVIFDRTPYEVHAVKVVINGDAVDGFNALDAVGIIDSPIPVQINVNVNSEINENLTVERLSDKVNSPFQDLKPILSPDGQRLYFSRANHPENIGGEKDEEDIWYSDRDEENDGWQLAQNIGRPLNNKAPNYFSSITEDGNTFIFTTGNTTGEDGDILKDLSIVTKTDSGWSEPEKIEIENYYNNALNVNFFLAHRKRTLLMSVERDDTRGERDLYVSFKRQDSTWSEPKNLGDQINTPADESSPYLSKDNKTLYFSSGGFSGYGGNDIYMSQRLDDTWQNWSEPQNLGPDINTEENEIFFNFKEGDEYAYYSRGNPEDIDLYQVKMPIFYERDTILVAGKITNAETDEPLGAKIYYKQIGDSLPRGNVNTNPQTGKYRLNLPADAIYEIYPEVDGFLTLEHKYLNLNQYDESKTIEENIPLQPAKEDKKVILRNVYFDFDKAVLREESYQQLDIVQEYLSNNKNIKIEIEGHTCSIGTKSYNKNLSQKRAQNVVDYLTDHGIEKDRLIAKGYGENQPLASNDDERGRKINRRVVFKVVETPVTVK